MGQRIDRQPDLGALSAAAAEMFVHLAQEAIATRGRFTVALAGGSTPRHTYKLLSTSAYGNRIDWSKVHIFWGDERCVSPDHEDSNYKAAREALLAHVQIDEGQIHRMKGELPPEDGAKHYGEMLQAFFSDGPPRFDLHLLGMGDDGHTASLFPHTEALKETKHRVVATGADHHSHPRLTMTAWAINTSAVIVIMVSGEGKAQMLHDVLHGPKKPDELPVQLIAPTQGDVVWLVDDAAASKLPESD